MMPQYRRAIEEFYGHNRAKRSGTLLMNHINEGVFILKERGASDETQAAFMIHPLFQNDDNLGGHVYSEYLGSFSQYVVLLAMEYRYIANSYLPKHDTRLIVLSPLPEVNEMLVADKIQNRKDFTTHSHRYSNANRLHNYFNEWLSALGISEVEYNKWVKKLEKFNGMG